MARHRSGRRGARGSESPVAWIYALSDPRTPYDYRYVGRTTWEVSDRVTAHIQGALSRLPDGRWRNAVTHKIAWIRALARDGYRPYVTVLTEVPREVRIFAEQQWIVALREAGYRLTNATDGGEGPDRYKPADETRRKQSAANKRRYAENPAEREFYRRLLVDRYKDPAEREASAEQARRQWAVPGAREAQSRRLKEICAQPGRSASIGRTLSKMLRETERGAAILRAQSQRLSGEGNHSAKLSWVAVREIRSRYVPGVTTQSALAAEYGVTQTLIGQILRGSIWNQDPTGTPVVLPLRKLPPAPLTDECLTQVATVYTSALTEGRPPSKAVAAHFGITLAAAYSRVGLARKRGLLTATPPGRPTLAPP